MRVRTLSTVCTVSAAALLAASGTVFSATAASGTGPVAPRDWSTATRAVHRSPLPAPVVTGIRVGHHPHFDRVVVDLSGRAPGFSVRYVRTLRADASGQVRDLLGPVTLRLVLSPADAHDPETGVRTLTTRARTKWRLDQIRETRLVGDFEAVVTLGVGLARRTPFRVLTLHDGTRIVVDVRHR